MKPSLPIIARSEGVAQTKELYDMGVSMVVLPEMETGLEIARQALVHLEISWVQLKPSSPLINKSIKESAVRTRNGLNLKNYPRKTETVTFFFTSAFLHSFE